MVAIWWEMLLPDLTDYFQGVKSLFHWFQVLLWFCIPRCQDFAVALCGTWEPRWSCWKLQMIQPGSNVSPWHKEPPHCMCCHSSCEAPIQTPDYLWLFKVPAHLLKIKSLNPSVWAKTYFKWCYSAFPVLFQMELVLAIASCFKLRAGLLCFGTADVFQKHCAALMCEVISVYPSLCHRNGMRINQLWPNHDPSEVKRRVSFHGYHGGQG